MKDRGVSKEPGISWIQSRTSYTTALRDLVFCLMWKRSKNKLTLSTMVRSSPLPKGSCACQMEHQFR